MLTQLNVRLCLAGGLILVAPTAQGSAFSITQGGKPTATIVISQSPTVAAKFAAKELQDHVELISGATLPIASDVDVVDGPRILIGESIATKKVGIKASALRSQEVIVRFLPDTLVLIGKDKPDAQGEIPGLFDDRGSLNAVYELLERFCGVRWYHATELGAVYSKRETLTVNGNSVKRMPDMKYTWITPTDLWMPRKTDYVARQDGDLWKLRMRLGGEKHEANHSFYGYYDRFLKTHRDWFAQGYSGQPPQMCYTNEGFIAQVVQDARDYFDGKGLKPGAMAMGDYFGAVPMDTNNWCKCERCQAVLKGCDVDNQQFSSGKASNYIWGFVNKVAREVRKTHPDKYIAGLAYWEYAHYPTNVRLESNIAVQLCLAPRNWFVSSSEKNDMLIFNDWTQKEKDRPVYLWLYYNFPALNGWGDDYNVFPGFFAHSVAKQVPMYQKAGVRGIFMEHSSEFRQSHLLDLPDIYVTVRMAKDKALSGDAIIDEFFSRYYGAAGKPMKEIYSIIEKAYYSPSSYSKDVQESKALVHQDERIAWEMLGTKERMDEMGALMAQARQLASTDTEKKRLALFDEGIWQYMLDGFNTHPKRVAMRNAPIPSAKIPRIGDAGGDLAKVDWPKAAVLDGWRKMSGDETTRRAKAWIAHDGQWLYVRLEEQLDTSRLISTDNIWNGDDWEMRFARQRSEPSRQMSINPDGKHQETAYGEDSPLWDANPTVVSDKSSPDKWVVTVALRLDELLPEGIKPGDTIYANFYRGVAWQSELLGWSPNFKGSFHEMSRLGELVLE